MMAQFISESPASYTTLEPSRNSMTSYPGTKVTESDHVLLVGGGPRSVIQVNSEVIFMFLYRQHFEQLIKLGASYNIITSIVEKRPSLGVGAAYSAGQTGMMNSGIEDDISFPISLPFESENLESLKLLLSYKHRYDIYIGQGMDAYYEELRRKNLPGAVMFKRSVGPNSTTKDGQLEHERAYLMRGTVGEEEYETFEIIRSLAKMLLPFYRLRILPSSVVDRISVQKNGKPVAVVQSIGKSRVESIPADQMRLNTGTMTRSPVSGMGVAHLTFCQAMNVEHFKKYCSDRQMLDKSGFLVPGTKILSGGMGLSGLDQMSVLDGVMNLFEEDESLLLGYRVTDEAKRKYQGAITLISRTSGKVCYPRHTFTPEWKQGTPLTATTKHLHALFLHDHGQELFGIWKDIMAASVARAMNLTPDEANGIFSSTEDLLRFQFEETERFLESRKKAGREEKRGNMPGKERFLEESTKTFYGAWRQAALCLIFGFAIEEDLGKATEEMESYAPITWKGRQGWLFHRGQITSLTDPKFASRQSNMGYFKTWEGFMQHVTSSPVEIHSMFHLLIDSGIAKYIQAPYSEVHCSPNGDQLALKNGNYDAFIVSPVFERQEDRVVQSLAGQVQPYRADHPTFGKVGKFRRYQDSTGNSVAVEDNGLGGKGFNINTADGKRSRAGCFAVDLNNRASGVSVGSSFTLRRMALSHLKAAGVKMAEKTLDDIYNNSKPQEEAYSAEVQKFQVHFEEAFEIWAYLQAIKVVAGRDAELFQILYDAGLSRGSRKEQIRRMHGSAQAELKQAAVLYEAEVRQIPTFKPPSRNEYFDRFVDTTDDEDKFMYTEAFKLAKKNLELSR